ncbi:glycosyltransferase [Qipengyuania thermophila]|uniref:glycosyltransferase n=1 Tax=Qipengyuania thermophila TaxID=2509361 RepID=UPI001F1E7823|nr:glycosyltransferase family 2 protein [Qipengyuania thermophila]
MPELSVIVPTYNEADNLPLLHARLSDALAGEAWEMIVVDDDSPDGTAAQALALHEAGHPVRVIRRIGRRGLSTAVIEGMLSSPAPVFAVIDGDLQHDETLLPRMLATLRTTDADVVVATRYAGEGGVGAWSAQRARMSRLATAIATKVLRAPVSDPMSGFFMIRREAFDAAVRNLSGEGYKILLDLFASSPRALKVAELPYVFRTRQHGESKLDTAVLLQFGLLLLDKTVGRFIPARLVFFALVGGLGVIVHYASFALAFFAAGASFVAAQTLATVTAMTGNYILNNMLTYRDARRRGVSFFTGLLGFYLVCSIGLLGNVGIASYAFSLHYEWWLAAFAGIVVGTVWNFAASSIFVWRRRSF